MIKNLHTRKFAGTALLLLTIMFGSLLATGKASALFTFFGGQLEVTGTVLSVNPNSFQVDKGGTYPFLIVTNSDTVFDAGYASIGDINPGDKVRISAHEHQGTILAEHVSSINANAYGYGVGCETFEADKLWVSAIEQDAIFLSRANITFEAKYDGNTDVLPGNQSTSDLTVGETVAVVGEDCNDDGMTLQTIVRGTAASPGGEIACHNFTGLGIINNQHLLSHDLGGAYTPLRDLQIPAGNYDVYGVSFDNHTDSPWDTQTQEQWFVEGWSNGAHVYTSGTTDDLPNGVNQNSTQIGSNVAVPELTQVRLVHAAYPNADYHSILPECVVFVPVTAAAIIN